MKCPRCGGLMSHERMMGEEGSMAPGSYFEGWRCVHCGEVIDPLILFNRTKIRSANEKVGAGSGNDQ